MEKESKRENEQHHWHCVSLLLLLRIMRARIFPNNTREQFNELVFISVISDIKRAEMAINGTRIFPCRYESLCWALCDGCGGEVAIHSRKHAEQKKHSMEIYSAKWNGTHCLPQFTNNIILMRSKILFVAQFSQQQKKSHLICKTQLCLHHTQPVFVHVLGWRCAEPNYYHFDRITIVYEHIALYSIGLRLHLSDELSCSEGNLTTSHRHRKIRSQLTAKRKKAWFCAYFPELQRLDDIFPTYHAIMKNSTSETAFPLFPHKASQAIVLPNIPKLGSWNFTRYGQVSGVLPLLGIVCNGYIYTYSFEEKNSCAIALVATKMHRQTIKSPRLIVFFTAS